MLAINISIAQSSVNLNGFNTISEESFSSLNSFEFNTSNFSQIKDWGFSFTYGMELSSKVYSNLYQISASKNINNHFISVRYSPGFQKEFLFKSGEAITSNNTEPFTLQTKYSYQELFGIGYSLKFSNTITTGLNLRLFRQDFTEEIVSTIFTDTIYFIRDSEDYVSDLWKADFGIVWQPLNNVFLNFSTLNLFALNSNNTNTDYSDFLLKTNKAIQGGISYYPIKEINLYLTYETNSDMTFGLAGFLDFNENKIGVSAAVFHDNEQNPYLAGLSTSLLFTSKYFDISLGWLNYLSKRSETSNYNDFADNGLTNIVNNRFSFDKILLTTNFKLNTLKLQKLKFIDISSPQNIYPSMYDKYFDVPIVTAKVHNISSEKISFRAGIKINNFNNEIFQSPIASVEPGDTVDVNIYTLVPETYNKSNPELSYASFYLISDDSENFEDELQKAVLINGINSWDGEVFNLKYFIKRDLDFSIKYSRAILSQYKSELDTIPNAASDFFKARIIYNSLIKGLSYTSDPRASAEYVQFPKETIEIKGGDCDDLSVCYSSLLESIGIETALVDYSSRVPVRHVNLLFNTKLSPSQSWMITENDNKYFIRKNSSGEDEIWLPIETTSLESFDKAWSIGSEMFMEEAINNFGLIKGNVRIIDVY